MYYKVLKDKIVIEDLSDFCCEHILECGQIFTYEKLGRGQYKVFSEDKCATLLEYENNCQILTTSPDYFVNFFDLNTDYSTIKQNLAKDDKLNCAIKFGYGIRIIKQNLLETIIGFIISANNNIERIKGIMAKLRKHGKNMGDYYAFPTLKELQKISIQQFREMGAGYRAPYLVSTINELSFVDFEEIKKLSTPMLKKWLLSLKGVGPKVADCILLFGFSRYDSFPVDTWIEKVYIDIFGKTKSREKMSQDLVQYFGELSGYAQQYLFYYKRSFN